MWFGGGPETHRDCWGDATDRCRRQLVAHGFARSSSEMVGKRPRTVANPWDNESDDEASNSAGRGERLLMVPALVFFGVAALFGCLFRGIVRSRLRAVARQPDVSDGELCELKQANRITSVAVIASLVGLAVVGLAYAVF